HSTLLGLANAPSTILAKKLVDITPKGLCKVFYSDSGSTAVEIAIKMTYQYFQQTNNPKKKKFAHIINSYHGDTLGSVSVGGINLFHRVYKTLLFDTVEVNLPERYRFKGSKQDWADECFKVLEKTILENKYDLAGIIIEPLIQGAAGMLLYPDGYLKKVRQLCDKHNIIMIADEVATGFGRTGKMFACEHEDVVPDIMCLAKGITGGYLPLAVTITNKKIYDGFLADYKEEKTFFHGHTYTGNPICCSAALANIKVFEQENVIQNLKAKIEFLQKKLKDFEKLENVGDIRQKGFMVGIELVKDKKTKEPYLWEQKIGVKATMKAREKGVIIRPLGNVIVLMPPLCISKQELAALLDVVEEAVANVLIDS
ncbi:adenosylmethionine--8-amino-7-oxononanoate transaminase, partial [bacterium]|nr:adenosylmethionine--8-amino-7-oxononanoate transaminase [bacterium]